MSRAILIPVHAALELGPAVTYAARSSPEGEITLLQLVPADRLHFQPASGGSGEVMAESNVSTAGAVEELISQATAVTNEYDVDIVISRSVGQIGPATIEYASTNQADEVVVGVKKARLRNDPELQEQIDTLIYQSPVAYTIVRT